MPKYDHTKIEKKWQKYWDDDQTFAADNKSRKPKYYCLIEFPYPSGDGLHVGHPRSYTALDILARKRRMQGFNVLYPIGFDAFGLPSENYAIKTGIHPSITTAKNIATFTQQMKALGFSFDWNRVVTTTDPEYYKWTQWIFLRLFEHGLAYKAKIPINWCPKDKIGLANEEVINGCCERCGTPVVRKEKEQWMLAITKYADRLIEDLSDVDYLEKIKTSQINWIGRSQGAEITFGFSEDANTSVTVYTTRPDTLFGATFLVLSPEHPVIAQLQSQITNWSAVTSYQEQAARKSDLERTDLAKDKTGVALEGVSVLHPLTGQKIPVWIADYVLSSYGTGAIMAVPAHDERDYEFAKKFNLPIVEVIGGGDITQAAYTDTATGVLVNSGEFTGQSVADAQTTMVDFLEQRGIGRRSVRYKLRDWVFSRQRYWGEPIPMVYCENCRTTGASEDGWVPVPATQLPITLPEVAQYEPTDDGSSPLSVIDDWVNVPCPACGGPAKRETDTMPNWAGSNWYFLRYLDPHNDQEFASKKAMEYWMPVDWYNGGMEHTTLHVLYSRFIYKFLYDIGAVPKSCGPEPYAKRTAHGMILGEGGEKMSKSRGNVINPNDVVSQYGADTLRVYEMFMGPFDQAIPWDTQGVTGVRRFLDRVWDVYRGKYTLSTEPKPELTALLHKTIKKVTDDIELQAYNTAVSSMMIFINKVIDEKTLDTNSAETFLKLLSPFAPHLAEELWNMAGHKKSIQHEAWPVYDESVLASQDVKIVVQVNGKVRATLTMPVGTTAERVEELAREDVTVAKYLTDTIVRNVVVVPDRLINFVI